MNLNEIKKALYKENPIATFTHIKKGIAYYSCRLLIEVEESIRFAIPIEDMGDAEFLSAMDSKLLIRWIVEKNEGV